MSVLRCRLPPPAAPRRVLGVSASRATVCAAAMPQKAGPRGSVRATARSAAAQAQASHASDDGSYPYDPLVKMCGITTAEDASLAAQAGALYVGMILWPHSKRSVKSLSVAKEICAAAREFGAEPVGVFVSERAAEIDRACDAAGIHFAQWAN